MQENGFTRQGFQTVSDYLYFEIVCHFVAYVLRLREGLIKTVAKNILFGIYLYTLIFYSSFWIILSLISGANMS